MATKTEVPIHVMPPDPTLSSPDVVPRGGIGAGGEPSASSAFQRLASASQDMIVKRVDLALLEAQELLSRTLRGAALGTFGMILAAAAWFAGAACATRLMTEHGSMAVRLAIFGLLNAGGALGLVTLAMHGARQPAPVRPGGSVPHVPAKPSRTRPLHPFEGENGRGRR